MPSHERSRHDLIWKITPPPTDGEQTGAPDVKVLRPHELFPAPSSGQMQKINAHTRNLPPDRRDVKTFLKNLFLTIQAKF